MKETKKDAGKIGQLISELTHATKEGKLPEWEVAVFPNRTRYLLEKKELPCIEISESCTHDILYLNDHKALTTTFRLSRLIHAINDRKKLDADGEKCQVEAGVLDRWTQQWIEDLEHLKPKPNTPFKSPSGKTTWVKNSDDKNKTSFRCTNPESLEVERTDEGNYYIFLNNTLLVGTRLRPSISSLFETIKGWEDESTRR